MEPSRVSLTETSLERVRREDLHLFINAGLTATGQGGYYHGRDPGL